MRRPLGWLAAALGGFALYRLLTRQGARSVTGPFPGPLEAPVADTRADELRRKLEEARTLVDERDSFEEGETTVDRADPGESPEQRRREVHERGRGAVEQMRQADGG